jgi:hypothetical protein
MFVLLLIITCLIPSFVGTFIFKMTYPTIVETFERQFTFVFARSLLQSLTNFASISSGLESSFLFALNDASLEVGLSLTILISYAVNVPRS